MNWYMATVGRIAALLLRYALPYRIREQLFARDFGEILDAWRPLRGADEAGFMVDCWAVLQDYWRV